MSFPRVRSFQGRIFLAILAVALVPTALALGAGVLTLRSIGTRSGTLGAWGAVAESGRSLLDAVEAVGPEDEELRAAAARHEQALSESVRLSRLFAFVADRFVRLLPLAALASFLVAAMVAYVAARILSRGFAAPVAELAGWTERIAREEPLPAEGAHAGVEVEEVATLRTALRRMDRDLADGRRRAVENARMRSWTDFARRVAHELKNPLTPMKMAVATLRRGRTGPEAEAAEVLAEEIDRLDEMARAFARFGRMPEGPKSAVDLGEIARALAAQHGSNGVQMTTHALDGVYVAGYPDALERALRNLVVNAVEALDGPGGRVDLFVERDGTEARVRVEDDGPGIPPELIEEVWNPDVTTKQRGTGLGLAIVRQTVVHHGGTVHVANRPGGGAAFTLSFPLAPAPPVT